MKSSDKTFNRMFSEAVDKRNDALKTTAEATVEIGLKKDKFFKSFLDLLGTEPDEAIAAVRNMNQKTQEITLTLLFMYSITGMNEVQLELFRRKATELKS